MSGAGIFWLTGIPSSGKTTIGGLIVEKIRAIEKEAQLLDGDVIRSVLSRGLGFDKADRDENVRRLSWLACLLARNNVWAVVAAVSPYRDARGEARRQAEQAGILFIEVHVHCPLNVAESRDVKGLYAKARRGEVFKLTGVDDVYEAPEKPDVVVNTSQSGAEDCALKCLRIMLIGKSRAVKIEV